MKILDLFSGIGGFSLGLERAGFKTIAFCEMDKYCKLVLQKHWKGVKMYNDVREITKARFETDGIELPEIITGGFPCQPFSVAGKQKGTSDDRHLWPEMFRIIKEFKPRWVIGENVKGITNIQDGLVFETVCTNLEGEGYEVRAFNIPAAGVGAPHRRERIWIVAHSNDTRNRTPEYETNKDGQKTDERRQEQSQLKSSRHGENVENSRRTLRQGSSIREKNEDETRKEDADQHQRSSSSPEPNVANAESIKSREQTQRQGWENSTRRSIDSRGDSKKRSEDNVANANINGTERNQSEDRERSRTQQSSQDVANASAGRRASQKTEVSTRGNGIEHQSWWQSEPDVGRVAHGIPGRVHRLKALGNSIVPQIAEEIGKAIMLAEKEINGSK
tara:strand:+ start:329 stop:1498 length:1170 start_codon:yes stop_codon:yes gene_type:complete